MCGPQHIKNSKNNKKMKNGEYIKQMFQKVVKIISKMIELDRFDIKNG